MKKNKNDLIMDEYRKTLPLLEILEEVVVRELTQKLKKSGIRLQGIEHRLKNTNSLREKINRKRDKYDDIYDITDLLGVRVVCYFAEDVDRLAAVTSKLFEVDWEHSVDERKEISRDKAHNLPLDHISLKEFMGHSPQFCKFMQSIKTRSKSKEVKVSPDPYLENLDLLGVHTIGDLLGLLDAEGEHALELFEDMVNEQELGQLVSSVGLYLLCQARLVWSDKNEKQLLQYYRKTSRNESQADRRAKRILTIRQQKDIRKDSGYQI